MAPIKYLHGRKVITYALIALAVLALFAGGIYFTAGRSRGQNATQTSSAGQESSTTSVAQAINFNDPTTLAEARAAATDPIALHIREVFDEYLSGAQGDASDTALSIPASMYTQSGLDGGFDAFSKSLYSSRFIVIDVSANDAGGGEDYAILFLDYPQQVYTAWMYPNGDGSFGFRGFWLDKGVPASYGEDILRLNPRLESDPTLSS